MALILEGSEMLAKEFLKKGVAYGSAAILGYEVNELISSNEVNMVKIIERPTTTPKPLQENDVVTKWELIISALILLFIAIIGQITRKVLGYLKNSGNNEQQQTSAPRNVIRYDILNAKLSKYEPKYFVRKKMTSEMEKVTRHDILNAKLPKYERKR